MNFREKLSEINNAAFKIAKICENIDRYEMARPEVESFANEIIKKSSELLKEIAFETKGGDTNGE